MKSGIVSMCVAGSVLALGVTQAAQAQERYIGEVILFGGGFCPQSTLPADGRILQIAENSALFSILGVTYGGNGRTTYALPDLTDAAPGMEVQTARRVPGERSVEEATAGVQQVSLKYCVVTHGIYPSRPQP